MAMQDSDFVDRETLERVVVVQRKRFYYIYIYIYDTYHM